MFRNNFPITQQILKTKDDQNNFQKESNPCGRLLYFPQYISVEIQLKRLIDMLSHVFNIHTFRQMKFSQLLI